MRVLLTGGNGFIGSWVAKWLMARGVDLRVEGDPLPFAPHLAPDGRDALRPNVQRTALADGIAATIAYYRQVH